MVVAFQSCSLKYRSLPTNFQCVVQNYQDKRILEVGGRPLRIWRVISIFDQTAYYWSFRGFYWLYRSLNLRNPYSRHIWIYLMTLVIDEASAVEIQVAASGWRLCAMVEACWKILSREQDWAKNPENRTSSRRILLCEGVRLKKLVQAGTSQQIPQVEIRGLWYWMK